MFVLGHVGIGTRLLPRGLRAPLLWRWMALGCLLPDLVDKPIWLSAPWFFKDQPAARELLNGTRLFGHTLLCIGLLALASRLSGSARFRAVGLGAATHLFIDFVGDLLSGPPSDWQGWLLWPVSGWRFPAGDGRGFAQHLLAVSEHRFYVVGEIAGAALLLFDYFRWRLSGSKSAGQVQVGGTPPALPRPPGWRDSGQSLH